MGVRTLPAPAKNRDFCHFSAAAATLRFIGCVETTGVAFWQHPGRSAGRLVTAIKPFAEIL